MKRIDIIYDGRDYSVADQQVGELQARISAAQQGGPDWLEVNFGEGQVREARLLIGPGIPISLMVVAASDDA
ncbi:hypothetical protein NVV95_10170 [Herbiconiux sp. CPCC 205716]|uniref:Uncharacterized protein n=1 Tax=Herbiconiux gentiana TaxID=2970912 RepID=A0ABT2GH48_9MICO|nr:hypothetical protein [Herbiconiux gentiana]MCS5714917.1 hypothetical protein [Herbiconiux gentiana]